MWLLDVDGVINVDKPNAVWDSIAEGHAIADHKWYRMRWAPLLIRHIRDMHVLGLVEVVWCTTWCDYAHNLEELWQLPKLKRAFTDFDINSSVTHMKVGAASNVLDSGRRLIWTDDVVPRKKHLFTEEIAAGNALLIGPDAWFGLTNTHITRIKTFIEHDHVTA